MDEKLEQSQMIIRKAIEEIDPYAIVVMFSGGTDSLTAYHVAKYLHVPISGILHINTGTGIPETTQFVRAWAERQPYPFWEAQAGNDYEEYLDRKGFFGRGMEAHNYAWHVLKAGHYRKMISRMIRQRKRNRRVLLINGARRHESENRMFTMKNSIQRENEKSPNYWVNIINEWSGKDCVNFLAEYAIKRNPVSEILCRSGECMCGTMQSFEERQEASFWYPHWGRWLNTLERRIIKKWGWGWGEEMLESIKQERAGQLVLPNFTPMCSDCLRRGEDV